MFGKKVTECRIVYKNPEHILTLDDGYFTLTFLKFDAERYNIEWELAMHELMSHTPEKIKKINRDIDSERFFLKEQYKKLEELAPKKKLFFTKEPSPEYKKEKNFIDACEKKISDKERDIKWLSINGFYISEAYGIAMPFLEERGFKQTCFYATEVYGYNSFTTEECPSFYKKEYTKEEAAAIIASQR